MHPFFPNILLHTDAELSSLLDSATVERETLHEWPLSCVQRLLLADGTTLVYKSQLPPTVEPQFYEAAVSRLLPGYRRLGKLGGCDILLLDWIDAPLLRTVSQDEADLAAHGHRLVGQIGDISGNLPVYLDIGSAEAWAAVVEITLAKLDQLISDRRFGLVDKSALEQVQAWSTSAEIVETIGKEPRLVHGDLKADQVFVTADGYRVIDWQRPMIAPPEIDLVSLLIFEGLNPALYVSAAVIGIRWFLQLHWSAVAQHDLFPGFAGQLFDQWAAEAIAHIRPVSS
jgi:hypothetical protein